MNRRTFVNTLAAASTMVLAGHAAFAATFAEDVVNQLTQQGFHNIAVATTWLGRMRIVAGRPDGTREIILNPRTGEVLRDTWQAAGDGAAKPIIDDIASATDDGQDTNGGDGSGSGSGSGSGDGSGSGSGSGSGDTGDNSGDDTGGNNGEDGDGKGP